MPTKRKPFGTPVPSPSNEVVSKKLSRGYPLTSWKLFKVDASETQKLKHYLISNFLFSA
jgi:hypothetical protein